jgi:DNA-binding HxlR family transcriptional regulator
VVELHKSRLQSCVEILCALSSGGPLKRMWIRRKVKMDNSVFLERLRFLVDRGLVEKKSLGKYNVVYGLTERGLSVLRVLDPLVKEALRIELQNFEAISSALEGEKLVPEKKRRWRLSDLIKVEIVNVE